MIKRGLLVSILTATCLWASDPVEKGYDPFQLAPPNIALQTPAIRKACKALAKTTGLTWTQTGSTVYINHASAGNPAVWAFSGRDTTIFDSQGYLSSRMTSSAHSGWAFDSLSGQDSYSIVNGRIVDYVSMSYGRSNDTLHMGGNREDFAHLNGGDILVVTYARWNDIIKAWVPTDKDSVIYSAPIGYDYWLTDMTNYVGQYAYRFDGTNSSWKRSFYVTRVDAESNGTTLTLGGQEVTDSADIAIDVKYIYTFNATDWLYSNRIEGRWQVKDAATGVYHDVTKDVYTPIGIENYSWDSAMVGFVPNSKYESLLDSFGNETLSVYCMYNVGTLTWDTTRLDRHERTYDANGNNVLTVYSYFDRSNREWNVTYKDSNTFAQINTLARRTVQLASSREISILKTPTRLTVKAPGITGVAVYDVSGRMVASLRQRPAESLTLGLTRNGEALPGGMYVVKISQEKKESAFTLAIQR